MGHLKRKTRAGFTIVELLTVITIMGLMTSLLVGASFRFVASARESATATTIQKASGIIQDRVRSFQELNFSLTATELMGRLGGNVPKNLAEVLARKARFKKAFPQAFAEMDAAQQSRFFGTTAVPPTNAEYKPIFESGIVLYAVLTKGETFGAPTPGEDTFGGAEVLNSAETGNLPCLVDSWGQPLRFYRWPTRLIRCGETGFGDYNQNASVTDAAGSINNSGALNFCPAIRPCPFLPGPTPASLLISNLPAFNVTANPATGYVLGPDTVAGSAGNLVLGWPDTDDPEPLNTDSDDPSFLLSTWVTRQDWANSKIANYAANPSTWITSSGNPFTNASVFVNGAIDTSGAQVLGGYHDVSTYSVPLIVSAGPDRQLGLFEPTDVPTVTAPSVHFGFLAAPNLPSGGLTGSALLKDLFDNITNQNQRAGGK